MSWADLLLSAQGGALASLEASGRPTGVLRQRMWVGAGRVLVDGVDQLVVSMVAPQQLSLDGCTPILLSPQIEVWRHYDPELLEQWQLTPNPGPGVGLIQQMGLDLLADMQALARISVPGMRVVSVFTGSDAEQAGMVAAIAQVQFSTGV